MNSALVVFVRLRRFIAWTGRSLLDTTWTCWWTFPVLDFLSNSRHVQPTPSRTTFCRHTYTYTQTPLDVCLLLRFFATKSKDLSVESVCQNKTLRNSSWTFGKKCFFRISFSDSSEEHFHKDDTGVVSIYIPVEDGANRTVTFLIWHHEQFKKWDSENPCVQKELWKKKHTKNRLPTLVKVFSCPQRGL